MNTLNFLHLPKKNPKKKFILQSGKIQKLLFTVCIMALVTSCSTTSQTPDTTPEVTPNVQTPDITPEDATPPDTEEAVTVRLGMLSGPTGMGAAKLMADAQAGLTENSYETELFASNDQVAAQLTNGSMDIAALSTSVAATLYNKGVPITLLVVNTEGVLYLLEKGDTITKFEDIQGKTIWATGQGANPEYILQRLLQEANLDPQTDVTIEWLTAEEIAANMTTQESGICMLPVPATTALMLKDSSIQEVANISQLWSSAVSPVLPMGCVVVRNQFLEEHPETVTQFLAEYQESIAYMQEGGDDQAQLIADFSITPSAAVAKAALPASNITFYTGRAMKADLETYFVSLFKMDPDCIGGSLPYDDFYYVEGT